jgi:YfiH family protein
MPTQMLPGVRWGFSTRHGGVTEGPRGSLTLAAAPGVPEHELVENWRRALEPLDAVPDQVALMSQVHGATVLEVAGPTGVRTTAGEADALVTRRPDVVLAVRVADCVPILLAGPGVVAAVHAGWRGLAAGVVPAAVAAMDVDGIVAVVGPHISADAYEVGPEVITCIAATGVPTSRIRVARGDRVHADLGAAAVWQLEAAGVTVLPFEAACTTGPDHFSHRHEGPVTGRQAGMIVRCS